MRIRLPALLLVLAAVLSACGTTASSEPAVPTGAIGSPLDGTASPAASEPPSGSAGSPSAAPTASAELTPVPGGPTPSGEPTTTQTDWGEIVDALPAGFPVFPGAQPADGDPRQGPVSGAFSAPSDGLTVTQWYQEALERADYSTEALSGPLEDGSTVIDSVGATPDCRVQTTIRPLSGTTLVTVLYGAGCLD